MNQRLGIIKNLFFIFSIFLFTNFICAATVSDNDGSAFITKAEFDALKSSFQSQIDTYNVGIDSKIDTAIASYLSGIKISKESTLPNTTSILNYPIKVYSTNKGNWDMANWEDGTSGIWRPGWNMKLLARRTRNQIYKFDLKFSGTSEKEFIDLKKDTSTGNYNINTVYGIKDITLNFSYWILWYQTAGVYDTEWFREQSIAVAIDPKSWATTEKVQSGYYTMTCQDNYSENIKIDGLYKSDIPFMIGSTMYWNGTTNWTTDKGTWPYDKIKCSNGGSQYVQAPAKGIIDSYDTSMTKTSKELNSVYNGSNDSYVPVSFDGNIYITNNNKARSILINNVKQTPLAFDGTSDGCPSHTSDINKKINFMIEPGYCLEPVDKGSPITGTGARTKDKRCLWHPNDIYYKVTMPQTKNVVEHNMTSGILLTEIPDGVTVENIMIKINTDLFNDATLDSSKDVNIVFSKEPIDIIDESKCFYIYDSISFDESTRTKTKKLVKGENKLYIKDITAGEKLYYKVYFDNTVTRSVSINEPEVVLTIKD